MRLQNDGVGQLHRLFFGVRQECLADHAECRTIPGPPYDTQTGTNLAPGPVPNEVPEPLLPADGTRGEIPTLNSGHLPIQRRPCNLPSHHHPIPRRPQVPLRTFPSQGQPPIPGPDRVSRVVNIVRHGPFTPRPEHTGATPGVRQAPPLVYPQVQSRVRAQIPPRVMPQTPHRAHVQMPPEFTTRTQGPPPMNFVVLRGPPPPYPGPFLSSGESMPGTIQAGPSTALPGAPGTSGISEIIRTTTFWISDDDEGSGSNVQPAPRLKRAGSSSTGAKRARKAPQKDLP